MLGSRQRLRAPRLTLPPLARRRTRDGCQLVAAAPHRGGGGRLVRRVTRVAERARPQASRNELQ